MTADCRVCSVPLPPERGSRRRYCGRQCKAAADGLRLALPNLRRALADLEADRQRFAGDARYLKVMGVESSTVELRARIARAVEILGPATPGGCNVRARASGSGAVPLGHAAGQKTVASEWRAPS